MCFMQCFLVNLVGNKFFRVFMFHWYNLTLCNRSKAMMKRGYKMKIGPIFLVRNTGVWRSFPCLLS